ncbi:MAG TPA: BBE domain-containing protein, partial [Jatrophihabitans sp.]|nr:BBE domain-containing protein [Jatrophihabitans sp.]
AGPQRLSPMHQAIVFRHGGAVARVPADFAAAGNRDAAYMAHPIATWQDPAEDGKHITWARQFSDAFAPFATGGVYLNFEQDEGTAHVRRGFDTGTYAKLVALKDKWDPANVFRMNQNIVPSRPPVPASPPLAAAT